MSGHSVASPDAALLERAEEWLAKRHDLFGVMSKLHAYHIIRDLATALRRALEERDKWQTCSQCGEKMEQPGHCPNARDEEIDGYEQMLNQALDRAETAEAELAQLRTREREARRQAFEAGWRALPLPNDGWTFDQDDTAPERIAEAYTAYRTSQGEKKDE